MHAYRQVANHGGVAAADPHGLIVMLLDGALERISAARGCMQRGAHAEKNALLHRAVSIVDELRNSLDLKQGEVAVNLDRLYEYVCGQLLQANIGNRADCLDVAAAILNDIRAAWVAIGPEARRVAR